MPGRKRPNDEELLEKWLNRALVAVAIICGIVVALVAYGKYAVSPPWGWLR